MLGEVHDAAQNPETHSHLLKRKGGGGVLSYKDCLMEIEESLNGQEKEMGSPLHFVLSPAFSRLTSLLEYAAVKESRPGKAP